MKVTIGFGVLLELSKLAFFHGRAKTSEFDIGELYKLVVGSISDNQKRLRAYFPAKYNPTRRRKDDTSDDEIASLVDQARTDVITKQMKVFFFRSANHQN